MNAVEIEQAITDLAEQPFDRDEFPYAFLEAFGNKETTIKRLRAGVSNKSDLGGILQTNNIHILTCDAGQVSATLKALSESPATTKGKARFVLATDGVDFEAIDLQTGDTVACTYSAFPDHFGFFLPLAGISTVRQITENAFDIRATSRLNRLYVELLKDNPEWGKGDRRHDMNHLMARLIFCFFAEDTNIFAERAKFTPTVAQMSAKDSSNTHEVIGTLFRAMNTKLSERAAAGIPRWAEPFPYVNGGLFSAEIDIPRFSRIARSYLLHVGGLDWTRINPDIFGSMIQAVADEDERGELGMHYTSVPNILKVLNPLFLDDLRAKLEEAGTNSRKLLHLRDRISRIRVFDPACGSGNFLVIAYKELRALEAEINKRRSEPDRRSDVPITNFRGIELRDFPAEIARLALVIAEYQCDVLYRGQRLALAEFLPLRDDNWIVCGNALRLDWLSICPPTGSGVKVRSDDLFGTPLNQPEIDFANEGGETYICGNPPYLGAKRQTVEHKQDLKSLLAHRTDSWRSLDYVAGWFIKAADYCSLFDAATAFVATNSVCQGIHVPILWPLIFAAGQQIAFAHTSFKWSNLASRNAGVTVVIVGITKNRPSSCLLFSTDDQGTTVSKYTAHISAYLTAGRDVDVQPAKRPISDMASMDLGNMPKDGGNLLLTADEARTAISQEPEIARFVRDLVGSQEYVKGIVRRCLWIEDDEVELARESPFISARLDGVRAMRLSSDAASTRDFANRPHRFKQIQGQALNSAIVIPKVSSESRAFLPVGLLPPTAIVSDAAFAIYDAPLWNMAILASRMHFVWVRTVCGQLETRLRYSNSMGWNAFPLPTLTAKNRDDLLECAEGILLARESHFPATIADLYNPETMPQDLLDAHDRNDEVLERIYVGRRCKNDTERLEILFDLYSKMTDAAALAAGRTRVLRDQV